MIFSSMHESGQRKKSAVTLSFLSLIAYFSELNQLTGIAAILTFPLDIEVVEAEEREAKEEAERKRAEENGEAE